MGRIFGLAGVTRPGLQRPLGSMQQAGMGLIAGRRPTQMVYPNKFL